jgi:hypothetical protein
MIKKTVTYVDFNEEEHTEDFYFHLSKTDLIDLETGKEGGLGVFLGKVVKSGDSAAIMAAFKDILAASYGVRSEDGRRFIKDPGVTAEFMQSPAFDVLFFELITNDKSASEFILGVIPKDMASDPEIVRAMEAGFQEGKDLNPQTAGKLPWADREPTDAELRGMTKAQLLEVMKRKNQAL